MIQRLAVMCVFALLPLVASAQPIAPEAGVDYQVIDNGKPWQPLDGKVEVVEVFAYTCPHCANFEPKVDAWKQAQPKDVRFSYVPAAYDLGDTYARAYFAAEAAGAVARTHDAMFRAIHVEQSLPRKGATIDEIAEFFRTQGFDAAKLAAAMRSPAVDAKMQRARQFAIGSGIEGTPTVIVNGRYRVSGRSHEDTLRITSQLIAMERAKSPAKTSAKTTR